MSQLIIGAACGYPTELLTPFVKSLRRHYQGNAVLVVNPLTEAEQEFYDKYQIITFELDAPFNNSKDVQTERYDIYRNILDENFEDADHILISDIRDVMFQDDPFKIPLTANIEFFMEPCLYKNCTANAPWIAGIYGREALAKVANEYVICSGTTMGTRIGILDYLNAIDNEISRIKSTGRPVFPGEDQPIHNYLIYSGRFPNHKKHHNGEGTITTVHHQQQLTFDRQGRLLNKDGSPTPVIHQWDRADALAKVLEKTALG